MGSGNLLRKQVVSEIRKRKLILLTAFLLAFIYFCISLVFSDLGLLRYIELNEKKAHLEKQIKKMEKDNKLLTSEIKLLKEDPFYVEKYAREEFGLAKPDEYIFFYDDR